MTISNFFFLLAAHKHVYMNSNNFKKPVVLPRSACCFSKLLFPRSYTTSLQTLVVHKYAWENHRYLILSNYSKYLFNIIKKIANFFYKLLFHISSHADNIWVWILTSQKCR